MNSPTLSIRPAMAVLALWVLFFILILLNGYAFNLVGLTANPVALAILIALEGIWLARILARQRIRWVGEPLELASLLVVTVGVWLYFVVAALPTLLPPTLSGDAVNLHAMVESVFNTGLIVSDYPGGTSLITATVAHWIGILPLRLEHPIAALWIALTAGGVYGLACAMLPDRLLYKIVALFAPFALFVPWYYFAGTLIGYQYFSSQVAAQFFLIAFIWFLVEYRATASLLWAIGMAFCLVGISVTFQLWLVLPVALLVIMLAVDAIRPAAPCRMIGPSIRALFVVAAIPALFWLAILFAGSRFIPQASRLQSTGAVVPPSLDLLGGWFIVLPALGIFLALRSHYRVGTTLACMVLIGLQALAFVVANRWFNLSEYWVDKTFFLSIFPLALFAVIPIARLSELLHPLVKRISPIPAWGGAVVVLSGLVWILFPPPYVAPLTESEIQVGLWARGHLPTRHINYIGTKSAKAMWLGEGLWGEHYPSDLFTDLAVLGTKTFEEWRNDPDWGEYLFVASGQHLPLDSAMQTVYQYGDAAVVKKPTATLSSPEQPVLGSFGDIFALQDYSSYPRSWHAGEAISFPTGCCAITAELKTAALPTHQVVWRYQLVDVYGNAVTETRQEPLGGKFPLQRWPDGVFISQPLSLSLPADLAPGVYDLQLGLYYVGTGEPISYRGADGKMEDTLQLGRIKIAPPRPDARELETLIRVDARVGESFTLLGYRLEQSLPSSPNSVKIDLYWQCDQPVRKDYSIFVHLLDANGVIRAQRDSAPREGAYPTSAWDPGEIIVDSYTLALPGDVPLKDPILSIGMYDWQTLERLPIQDANRHALGDQLQVPLR